MIESSFRQHKGCIATQPRVRKAEAKQTLYSMVHSRLIWRKKIKEHGAILVRILDKSPHVCVCVCAYTALPLRIYTPPLPLTCLNQHTNDSWKKQRRCTQREMVLFLKQTNLKINTWSHTIMLWDNRASVMGNAGDMLSLRILYFKRIETQFC